MATVPSIAQLTPKLKASMRILIVDDERALRESCASVLQSAGYHVSLCGRGDKAKVLLERTAFDVVLLDLHMSETPGMSLLRTCLDAHPGTFAIMITGNPNVDTSLEARRSGAWDCLPKPFSTTQLQVLIGRAAHAVSVARQSDAMQMARGEREGEGVNEPYYAARKRLVAEFELHYLTQLLTQTGGNMSRAARVAGVDRTTLYRLMERHGLDRRVLTGAESQPGTSAVPQNGSGGGVQPQT